MRSNDAVSNDGPRGSPWARLASDALLSPLANHRLRRMRTLSTPGVSASPAHGRSADRSKMIICWTSPCRANGEHSAQQRWQSQATLLGLWPSRCSSILPSAESPRPPSPSTGIIFPSSGVDERIDFRCDRSQPRRAMQEEAFPFLLAFSRRRRPNPTAQSEILSWWICIIWIVSNVGVNVFGLIVVRSGGAVYSTLSSSVQLPITHLLFTSGFIITAALATIIDSAMWAGLAIACVGVAAYHFLNLEPNEKTQTVTPPQLQQSDDGADQAQLQLQLQQDDKHRPLLPHDRENTRVLRSPRARLLRPPLFSRRLLLRRRRPSPLRRLSRDPHICSCDPSLPTAARWSRADRVERPVLCCVPLSLT